MIENNCEPSCPWENEKDLWEISSISTLPFPDFYKESSWKDIIPIKTSSCHNSYNKKELCIKEWLTCNGGTIVVLMCSLFFYKWILKPIISRTLRNPLGQTTYNVLILIFIFVIQELLFFHYCNL
ncbi:uncharacterized protein [Centruroides vittatus]|uniref:uncharacterized protein n=1 Tax=Centruroides vittatus TaxID=120091 RepID=UPI00350EDDE1